MNKKNKQKKPQKNHVEISKKVVVFYNLFLHENILMSVFIKSASNL